MRLIDLPLTGMEKFLLAWAIVVSLLLAALAIGTLLQDGSPRLRRLLIGGLVLIAAMIAAWSALARDDGRYAQSPLKQWFDTLRSCKGPCCSDADGSALSDSDWETKDGRYRVRIPRHPDKPDELEWVDVPEEAVITEPNRAGRTMVWPIWGYLGVSIRCFMPGSMT